ncbi:hypothetical protein P6F46_09695 [Bacillus shihchuchen]|uniref:Uncharacterized protein n=1 Tax=Bacillus shihchuchen TaxID=3036942 RepID=A0ABT7KUB2_9BACI|nr:hypothetical protein [Bacillus shihchuchen]
MGSAFRDELSIPNTPADKAGKVIEKEFKEMQPAGVQVKVVFKAQKTKLWSQWEYNRKLQKFLMR